jgi:hypothetical protein
MIDYALFIQITFIIIVEISVLVCLYKWFIARWNSEKAFEVWKGKVTSEDDNTFREIMEPIILEISESVADYVVEQLEHRYRQSLGVMTNSAKASGNQDELTTGMMMAESVLKGMGMKSPNVQLIAKLAGSMGGLLSSQGGKDAKLF